MLIFSESYAHKRQWDERDMILISVIGKPWFKMCVFTPNNMAKLYCCRGSTTMRTRCRQWWRLRCWRRRGRRRRRRTCLTTSGPRPARSGGEEIKEMLNYFLQHFPISLPTLSCCLWNCKKYFCKSFFSLQFSYDRFVIAHGEEECRMAKLGLVKGK